MDFKRKQRIKGKPAKHYKEWYDETKQYRVSWRDEAFGVAMPSGFFACVRCSNMNGKVYWGFVGRRGLYQTLTAALDACDRNRQIWDKFLAIDGRAKVRQMKELKEHAIFGSGKSSYSMMAELPVWMVAKAPVQLMEILCGKDPSDPTEASNPSDNSSPTTSDTTSDAPTKTPAKRAKVAAKVRKKKSSKHTVKRSPVGKKKSKSTSATSKSKKKRKPNSRKKKSKSSKN